MEDTTHTRTGPDGGDHLVERLHHLRTIVPVFAEELANARRETTRLRTENRRLLNEVQRLQRERRSRVDVPPQTEPGLVLARDT